MKYINGQEMRGILLWVKPEERKALNALKRASGKTWREFILDGFNIEYEPIPIGRPVKN